MERSLDENKLIAACWRKDEAEVNSLLADQPNLAVRLRYPEFANWPTPPSTTAPSETAVARNQCKP